MKRLIITENEKLYIKKLYNIINEQYQEDLGLGYGLNPKKWDNEKLKTLKKGSVPFENQEDGNKFRVWFRNRFPILAVNLDLSSSGSYNNENIQWAYHYPIGGGGYPISNEVTIGQLYMKELNKNQTNNVSEPSKGIDDAIREFEMAIINNKFNRLSRFNILDSLNSDTLYFTFPGSESDKKILETIKKTGWISIILESYGDLQKLIQKCNEKGWKFKKIIVGSHGYGDGDLINPMVGGDFKFKTEWLTMLKSVLKGPDSEVHFTACHGADTLDVLKDAAKVLGVNVYGGKGTGYYGTAHEKGYYMCKPKPINESDVNDFYIREEDGTMWERPSPDYLSYMNWKKEQQNYGQFSGVNTPYNTNKINIPEVPRETTKVRPLRGELHGYFYSNEFGPIDWSKRTDIPPAPKKLRKTNDVWRYSDYFLLHYGYCNKAKQPYELGKVIGDVVKSYQN
jgi:hypothetical protein